MSFRAVAIMNRVDEEDSRCQIAVANAGAGLRLDVIPKAADDFRRDDGSIKCLRATGRSRVLEAELSKSAIQLHPRYSKPLSRRYFVCHRHPEWLVQSLVS